jgi:DNA-binding transcriptional LysR family regulator
MDLEQLRAFVETVRRGSFSLAAETLHVSQPALSRRIGRLEAEVGQRLLERGRPVATPTRAGLALLPFAERTVAEWERLLPELPAAADLAGTLHVSSSSAPAAAVAPPLLALFSERHPGVRTELHVMNSASVEECVRRRHCDVGFLGRPPRAPLLQYFPVAQDEVVLAVPRGHRLAAEGEVDAAELAGEPFVVREAGSGTWGAALAALAAAGVALPARRVAAEVADAQAQLAAIAAGQGIGFVSRMLAGAREGEVALVRLRGLRIPRAIHLLYDARHQGRLAEAFVNFVRARVGAGAGTPAGGAPVALR